MRFMGFSNKVAKISVFALALALVTSLGVVGFPSKADAQRMMVWSTKFVCHTTHMTDGIEANTVINVLNPTENDVEMNKKVVYSFRESLGLLGQFLGGETGGACTEGCAQDIAKLTTLNIGKKFGETLGPNDSFFVDCPEIIDTLTDLLKIRDTLFAIFFTDSNSAYAWPAFTFMEPFASPPLYVDGFLVIETRKGRRRNFRHPPLIVTAHHWVSSFGIIDREIVPTEPIFVRGRFELENAMTVGDIDFCGDGNPCPTIESP